MVRGGGERGPSIEARGEEGRATASGGAAAGVDAEGGGGEAAGVDGWDEDAAAAFLRRSARETIQGRRRGRAGWSLRHLCIAASLGGDRVRAHDERA